MNCFICQTEMKEHFTEQFTQYHCPGCKRIWIDAGCGEWETIPQPVSLDPENFKDGRSYSDAVKIKENE